MRNREISCWTVFNFFAWNVILIQHDITHSLTRLHVPMRMTALFLCGLYSARGRRSRSEKRARIQSLHSWANAGWQTGKSQEHCVLIVRGYWILQITCRCLLWFKRLECAFVTCKIASYYAVFSWSYTFCVWPLLQAHSFTDLFMMLCFFHSFELTLPVPFGYLASNCFELFVI